MILNSQVQPISIAAVVSPHGFGHAARASAVLESLRAHQPDLSFEIFSEAPEWFFYESLGGGFRYHRFPSDVGLVQRTPFEENLSDTRIRLEKMFLSENNLPERLADLFLQTGCCLALCDISPLGILAAEKTGIPSLLVENFTWDWIYAEYFESEPGLMEVSQRLQAVFSRARFHIQAEPICMPRRCDFVSRPVARRPRLSRETVRKKLGIPPGSKVVLVTAGGIEQPYPGLPGLAEAPAGIHFVIPGGSQQMRIAGNMTLLPHHSSIYHPDLVFSSDAVAGKLGYSTVAEAYYAGIPYAYVPRQRFRETAPLASFVRNHLGGFEISYDEFVTGRWAHRAEQLFDHPIQNRMNHWGSDEIARYILGSGLLPR